MIKRKITRRLEQMREDGGKCALLIDGARQVGKTFIVRAFAKAHYEDFIEINFLKMKGAASIFENVEDEKDVLTKLSTFVRLLAAQYMDGIQLKILNGEEDINFGSVYENAVAQELSAHGFGELTYYASNRHGEVDFVLEKDGGILLIEVKSGKHYKRHRALKRLLSDPEYEIGKSIVFNDGTLEDEGDIRYEPIYMSMFLEKGTLPESLIYDIGAPVSSLSRARSRCGSSGSLSSPVAVCAAVGQDAHRPSDRRL